MQCLYSECFASTTYTRCSRSRRGGGDRHRSLFPNTFPSGDLTLTALYNNTPSSGIHHDHQRALDTNNSNVGIYAILAQFAIIALVTGVLSFAAPYIVAVSIPSFGSYLVGACCLIVFGLQSWGFFGVYKEKPGTYRK